MSTLYQMKDCYLHHSTCKPAKSRVRDTYQHCECSISSIRGVQEDCAPPTGFKHVLPTFFDLKGCSLFPPFVPSRVCMAYISPIFLNQISFPPPQNTYPIPYRHFFLFSLSPFLVCYKNKRKQSCSVLPIPKCPSYLTSFFPLPFRSNRCPSQTHEQNTPLLTNESTDFAALCPHPQ